MATMAKPKPATDALNESKSASLNAATAGTASCNEVIISPIDTAAVTASTSILPDTALENSTAA